MMEVNNGYKFTELGEIPSDWEFKTLDSITIEHKQGYYTKEAYSDKGTKLIRITDLHNQTIDYDRMPTLEVSIDDYESYKVDPGDFLFARSGAIGRFGIVRDYDEKAIFASYIIRFKFNQKKASNDFIGYFYQSDYSERQLNKITQGSSNININANNIKSLKIPLPSLKEQQKIAEILSTVDGHIDQTDQLIEKSKELKKGLMQDLLTKGIGHNSYKQTEIGLLPSEWTYDYIDNFAERKSGHTPDKKNISYWQGTIPWISLADLSKLDKRYIFETNTYTTSEGVNNSSAIVLPKGTIVISRDATVGKIGIMGSEMATSQHFINYVCGENLNNIYLYYYLLSKKELFKRIAIGSTIKTIGLDFFKKLKIVVPPIDEQIKITNILTSVDEDIEGYEQEKMKYEKLKKGLMQQLLTGKTRVKVD